MVVVVWALSQKRSSVDAEMPQDSRDIRLAGKAEGALRDVRLCFDRPCHGNIPSGDGPHGDGHRLGVDCTLHHDHHSDTHILSMREILDGRN